MREPELKVEQGNDGAYWLFRRLDPSKWHNAWEGIARYDHATGEVTAGVPVDKPAGDM